MAPARPATVLGARPSASIDDGTLAPNKGAASKVVGTGLGPLSGLSQSQRLLEVLKRAIRMLPGETGDKLSALLSPTTLIVVAASLAVWAASHAFGVGEAVDLLMLGVGAIFIGREALDVLRHISSFASLTFGAKTEGDLDAAARHLADAIAIIGVDVVIALLLHGAGKAWSNRYRPSIKGDASLPAGSGSTTQFGDVTYSTAGSATDQALVRFHEMVHSFLSPKLRGLRDLRADFGTFGYQKSQLLRYIEEALAETYAQLRVNGIKGLPAGIRFPIKYGYVTLTGVLSEAVLAAGAITLTIEGMRYLVTLEEE